MTVISLLICFPLVCLLIYTFPGLSSVRYFPDQIFNFDSFLKISRMLSEAQAEEYFVHYFKNRLGSSAQSSPEVLHLYNGIKDPTISNLQSFGCESMQP